MADADKRRPSPRRSISSTDHKLAPSLRDPRRPLARGDGVWVYFDHQEPNYWPEHHHERVQVVLVFDGADCEVAWRGHDGRRVVRGLKPGHVWILPASTVQEIRWRETADLAVLFVEPETAREFCGFRVESPSIRPLQEYVDRQPAVGLLCDTLRAEARQPPDHPRRHAGVVGAALASFVLQAHFAPERSETRTRGPRLRPEDRERVDRHMVEHLSEPFSLPVLAHVARMSRWHFCRMFKAETTLTPREYFNRCRVLRAKGMIETGRFTFTQVMHALGFSELGHFTRVFKKHLHVAPRKFLPRQETQ